MPAKSLVVGKPGRKRERKLVKPTKANGPAANHEDGTQKSLINLTNRQSGQTEQSLETLLALVYARLEPVS